MKTIQILVLIVCILFVAKVPTIAQNSEESFQPSVRKVTIPKKISANTIYQEIRERYHQVLNESFFIKGNEHCQDALESARAYLRNASDSILSTTDSSSLYPTKVPIIESNNVNPNSVEISSGIDEIKEVQEQIVKVDRQIEIHVSKLIQLEKKKKSLQKKLQVLLSSSQESQ